MKSFFLLFLSLAACVSASLALTISDVSVRVPWGSTGFTLHVNSTDACVEWNVNAPHLIQLQHETCSKEAKVIPISSIRHDLTEDMVSSIVTANDGSEQVQCEVYLGELYRIEMLTSARRLYLGEVETLDIIGFDEEGNTFKTLNGLQFDWKTKRITNDLKDGAIQLLPLNDDKVRLSIDPSTSNHFDTSQTIICEGLEIGQAMVIVTSRSSPKILDEVEFSVFDKFELRPSPFLRLIPTSILTYELYKQTRSRDMIHVQMPNPKYVWGTSTKKVATIDRKLGRLTAVELGTTSVKAKDTSFELNQAKGTVIVVKPARLSFKFVPLSPALYEGYDEVKKFYKDSSSEGRNLVENVDYRVHIELFDEKGQPIHVTDNIRFEVSVEGDEFAEIIDTSKNMHNFVLKAHNVGQTSMKVKLVDQVGKKFPLSHSQMLRVFPRVKMPFNDPTIYLPVSPYTQQMYKLNAIGGSRNFKWLILDTDVASIDSKGMLASKTRGRARVYVFDPNNVFNGDSKIVDVSPPDALSWAPGKRETELGSHLCLKLQMLNAEGNAFAAFDAFKVTFRVSDYNIFSEEKRNCMNTPYVLEVKAKQIGYVTVQAHTERNDLRDEISIVAFDPLTMRVPKAEVNPIVIALGSTQPLRLQGGPVEWETFQLYRSSSVSVSIKEDDKKEMIPVRADEKHGHLAYFATCRNLGERQVTFVVKNTIHMMGAERTEATLTRKIICAHPESMKLTPHQIMNSDDRFASAAMSPIDPTSSRLLSYHVSTNSTIILKIDLFDKDRNAFSSFNSLKKLWHLSDEKIANFPDEIISYDGKRYLSIDAFEGVVTSNAGINNYNNRILKDARVSVQPPKLSLRSADIQLRVNVPMSIAPSTMLLFNHHSVTGEFMIAGGSGDFSARSEPSYIISHETAGKSVVVSPKGEGESTLTVRDLRFDAHPAVHAFVTVSDVAQIIIEGPQYVELGEKISLVLRAFDKNGKEFDKIQMPAMQPNLFSPSSKTNSIVIIDGLKHHLYRITGSHVGTVDVIASVVNSDSKIIRSQPFQIHVFPPVHTEPSTLVLIPGAKHQVRLLGGPSKTGKHSLTTFEIASSSVDKKLVPRGHRSDTDVITIDKRGVVTAVKYGTATIKLNRNIGGHQFASKSVEVFVVRLQSLRYASSYNTYDNSKLALPFKAISLSGLTATAVSVQSPFFSISHSVEEPDVADTVHPMSTHGHVLMIHAKRPGHTLVNVFAKFTHPYLEDYSLIGDTSVHVTEKLRLLDGCTSAIILPPRSRYSVHANRESVKYYIQQGMEQSSIRVNENTGRLFASSNEESSTLVVRDQMTGQKIVTKVQVDVPEYLNIDSDSHLIFLPLGSSRVFKFFGQNGLGERMSTLNGVDLNAKSNMHEHVDFSIDNDEELLHIHALTTGNSTLQISSPQFDHTLDIKVIVVSTIKPSHPALLVGDKLKFHISAQEKPQGVWRSTNSSILKVDPISGNSVAISPGSAEIQFNSDTMSTSSQVEVKKISSALLSTSKKHLLLPLTRNADLAYSIPITFYDQHREYISLDTADYPYTSLQRTLRVECQATNAVIRVIRSSIENDKVFCTIQQNFAATSEQRMESVRFVLHISNAFTTYSIQSDPFFVNLTDSPLSEVSDPGLYLEGEHVSDAMYSPPSIVKRFGSFRSYIIQIFRALASVIVAMVIYKLFSCCAYRINKRGVQRVERRNLRGEDLDFRGPRSMFSGPNGTRLRNYQ